MVWRLSKTSDLAETKPSPDSLKGNRSLLQYPYPGPIQPYLMAEVHPDVTLGFNNPKSGFCRLNSSRVEISAAFELSEEMRSRRA